MIKLPAPDPKYVTELLEVLSVGEIVSGTPFMDVVYKYTHISNDPSCIDVHQDWIGEFWMEYLCLWSEMHRQPDIPGELLEIISGDSNET